MAIGQSTGAGTKSWGDQTLAILFTVFTIAIVFGVILIAGVITTGSLASVTTGSTSASTASLSANRITPANSLPTNGLSVTLSSYTWISSSNPLTLTITGNSISTFANNALTSNAAAGTIISQTYTLTTPQATTALTTNSYVSGTGTTGAFYNISSVTMSGAIQASPTETATVTETFNSLTTPPSAPAVFISNTIVGIGTYTLGTIGSTGQTPIGIFISLLSYLVTLANFVGIIILLAIIVVVVGVLYFFFGNREKTSFGNL